ncbi:MAG TPA: DNA ligase D [Candidatus Binataceae bacterium]|nr:DNA ligase D [Candidatus Binataceae bacterium]
MPLDKYRRKRSAERTPEPFGSGALQGQEKAAGGMFVVQKHAARRLHYDFRLEMEGVLRSWAVPKGPSMNPADKRLAVMVEDHPIEYGDFEGKIPEGNYGAGNVIVWDRGEYHTLDPIGDAARGVREGKLDISLSGFKLHGAFTLVRIRGRQKGDSGDKQQWLLIKKRDEFANDEDVLAAHPLSVLSGLPVEQIGEAGGIGREVVAELRKLGAPQLKGKLGAEAFPLTLAKLVDNPFDGDGWLFEIKYDGVRALAVRDGAHVKLFARSGTEITGQYPEVALAFDALPFERFAIDGEIVAFNESGRPSFQMLQRRMHVQDARDVARLSYSTPVVHLAFDLLAFENFDLRPLKLEERKRILSGLIKGEGPIRYCDHFPAKGRDFYDAVAAEGLEGMVAKCRDSPYRGKRTGDWLKIKCPTVRRFVIGGYTDPEGGRAHFGALLLGQFEADGQLRFISKVGTGFSESRLNQIFKLLSDRKIPRSPFRTPRAAEPSIPRHAHFCEPELVCEVRFGEWTDEGGIRHPSFQRLIEDADPRECRYEPAQSERAAEQTSTPSIGQPATVLQATQASSKPAVKSKFVSGTKNSARFHNGADSKVPQRSFTVTNPDKIFWPAEKYTKRDLVDYYQAIAPWMLPYLKDRPVMLVRYPDGIDGKSFYQKDAPGFAPEWLRTEKIYSEDSQREISYFILESKEAIGYMANLGTIPIHIWSSRLPHLERPDWLLFDIDPKGSTTERAIKVAQGVGDALREMGLRPCLKTSGQMGLHVMVGLKPHYTYEQARMFSELIAQLVVARMPEFATINRNTRSRQGKVYIDYLQLGHGKTIAAPFAVRPLAGAPVSAPLKWDELRANLDPAAYNIKTMPKRMARLSRDPFIGVLEDQQSLEDAMPQLEALLTEERAHQ